MKIICIITLLFISLKDFAQSDTLITGIKKFQQEITDEYNNPSSSPLNKAAKKSFAGIHFFDIRKDLIVEATFVRSVNENPFTMNTSSGKLKQYIKYGVAEFEFSHQLYHLNIYQSLDLLNSDEYKDYLFIPFTDDTNGKETYEGGRYIDLNMPLKKNIIINFNKAYQPYCAYTEGYNCPIPPKENYLPVRITAGVKF